MIPQVRLRDDSGVLEKALEVLNGSRDLKRLQSASVGNDIYVMDSDQVSISQMGSRVAYTLSHSDFRDCLAGARTKNVNLAILERIAGRRNMYDLRALLLTMEQRRDLVHVSVTPDDQPRAYCPILEGEDPECRVPGTVICPPVIDSAFVPGQGPTSDCVTVEMRIDSQRPKNEHLIPGRFDDYAEEFTDFISCKGKKTLRPLKLDELCPRRS